VLRLPGIRVLRERRFRLIVGVLLVALAALSHLNNLLGAWNGYEHGADFGTLMAATRYIWHGYGYAPMHIGAPEQFLTGAHSEPYPPSFFLLVGPWAFMPAGISVATWIALEELALAALVVLVWRGIGRPAPAEALLAIAMLLVFLPVRENLFEGQMGVFLTLAAVVAMLGLSSGRQVLAGIPLGLVIALKLTPAILLPYFLWRRGWRLVASAVATAGLVAAATLAIGWAPRWPEYIAELGPLDRGTAFIGNQSLNGVLLRAWNPAYSGQPIGPLPTWLTALWYGLNLVLIGLVVLAILRLDLPQPLRAWTELSLVLLAMPLVQPFAWFHHHAGAVVALLVGIRLVRLRMLDAWPAAGLAAAYLIVSFVAYPVHRAARDIGGAVLRDYPALWVGTSVTVAAVLLALFCLGRARSGRVTGTPART